mgnify:CR=1 FL=1
MIQEAIAQYLQKQRQVLFSPKAVLFDMDGVLYDSMRFHARAWYETATHHQLISTPELFYLYEGRVKARSTNCIKRLSCEMRPMRKRNPSMKKKLSCSINITMERQCKERPKY